MNLKKWRLRQPKNEKLKVENLRTFWDEYAQIYDDLLIVPVYQDLAEVLLRGIIPSPGGNLHDGGCGTGRYLKEIMARTQAGKVVATDISPEMISRAKQRISLLPAQDQKRVEFHLMDLTKQWPPGEFDLQVFQFLNYLAGDGWKRIITKSYQTTKPGGYVYFSTLLSHTDVDALAKAHLVEQISMIPFRQLVHSLLPMIKAPRIVKRVEALVDEGQILLPAQEELKSYAQEVVGFDKVEILGAGFWGAAPVFRLQKLQK